MARTKEFDNTNRGALFKNDKEGNDKRPDYVGPLDINGEDYRISAWLREVQQGENQGSKYMSIQVEPKSESVSPGPKADDDVPF